jgi:hypothetical protein
MCWSEQTSWLTLVMGTAINIAVTIDLIRRKSGALVVAIISFWQFGLLMQLPEALIWCSKGQSEGAIQLAFWLNVLQPVYAYAVLFGFLSGRGKIIVGAVVAAYTVYVLARRNRFKTNVFSSASCPHISLVWWRDRVATALYFAASIAALFAIPDPLLRSTTLAIWAGSFALTQWIYPCSYGSLWCGSIVIASTITYVVVRQSGGDDFGRF